MVRNYLLVKIKSSISIALTILTLNGYQFLGLGLSFIQAPSFPDDD